MKFEDIGFNDKFLSSLSYEQFVKNVAHHFTGANGAKKIDELWQLIQAKNKSENPGGVADAEPVVVAEAIPHSESEPQPEQIEDGDDSITIQPHE